jgi:hypothetical protein
MLGTALLIVTLGFYRTTSAPRRCSAPAATSRPASAPRSAPAAAARLIRYAQQAGQVRADVKPNEAYAVMAGTARALAQARVTGAARRRAVAIVIDGLRRRGPTSAGVRGGGP